MAGKKKNRKGDFVWVASWVFCRANVIDPANLHPGTYLACQNTHPLALALLALLLSCPGLFAVGHLNVAPLPATFLPATPPPPAARDLDQRHRCGRGVREKEEGREEEGEGDLPSFVTHQITARELSEWNDLMRRGHGAYNARPPPGVLGLVTEKRGKMKIPKTSVRRRSRGLHSDSERGLKCPVLHFGTFSRARNHHPILPDEAPITPQSRSGH